MKLTIYYSVHNGGDGSAYPHWYESEKLAEWHQDHQEEGFGESCTGDITFEGENLKCLDEVTTKESYFLELYLDGWGENDEQLEDFKKEFFKELPKFNVEVGEQYNSPCYNILYKNKIVYQYRNYKLAGDNQYTKEGALILQNELNSIE